MYLGRIVEQGDADDLFAAPAHPYTQALVSAIAGTGAAAARRRIVLPGEPPNPVDRPAGCAFHPRCPHAIARCRERGAGAAAAGGRQARRLPSRRRGRRPSAGRGLMLRFSPSALPRAV